MRTLCFDTETSGLPRNYKAPYTDVNNWPRLVQLGYVLLDGDSEISCGEYLVKPDGFVISPEVSKIHGITHEFADTNGIPLQKVLEDFLDIIESADKLVGHNLSYDLNILGCEYFRMTQGNPLVGKGTYDTMQKSTHLVKLPGGYGGSYKWPKLKELYRFLFNEDLAQTHTALDDIRQTVKCYAELVHRGVL